MAASFPTTIPAIQRVLPTDLMNASGKEADVLHNKLCDEVEALATVVGVTGSVVAGTVEARLAELQATSSIYGWQTFTPDGIGWDYDLYPIAPSITRVDGRRRVGSAGITPEALFDLFSTARTSPVTTYYVGPSGLNTNTGLSPSQKFLTLNKAVTSGNATGSPYKVYADASLYPRSSTFSGTGSTQITQDAAFIAVGGKVVCSPCDQFSAPSLGSTYTNCYEIALTNVERVLDLTRRSKNGRYDELTNVATAALCNVRPGTWASVSGTVYVNRSDGLAVTYANTRLLRTAMCMGISSQVSVFLGSEDGEGSWEFQGSDWASSIRVNVPSASPGANDAIVISDASFCHSGGLVSTAGRCVEISSYPGLVALFGCSATGSKTDLFNMKNNNNFAPPPAILTVNCSGVDTGEYPGTSCNAWTLHDNVVGIDIAGYYEGGAGGTIHNIGTTKAALVGTYVGMDRGDVDHGGTIYSTAIRAADTATIDCYAVSVWQPQGMAYHADDTSVVRLFGDCTWPARYSGNVSVVS